ncbi:hypothetical protein HAX54_041649 [Datura stramonium]|uniref:Uncharacterized protein n=1 Tax=Datura stramonium TaxID=4076 RepID=A0ABS8SLS3_DATST|nr:hypothetical protein [Datura stramonium]
MWIDLHLLVESHGQSLALIRWQGRKHLAGWSLEWASRSVVLALSSWIVVVVWDKSQPGGIGIKSEMKSIILAMGGVLSFSAIYTLSSCLSHASVRDKYSSSSF